MDNVGWFESSWILIWLSSWCFLVTCQEHIDRAYHVAKIAQHIAVKSESDVQDRPPSVTPKQSHQRRRTLEAKSMKINELPHQCPLKLHICIKLLSRSASVVLVCLPETSRFMATYFVLLFNLAISHNFAMFCHCRSQWHDLESFLVEQSEARAASAPQSIPAPEIQAWPKNKKGQ